MQVRARLAALGAAALAVGSTVAILPAEAQTTPQAVRFDFTGAAAPYTVPAATCSIDVLVAGASGGSFRDNQGSGGTARATVAVTPGQSLTVVVGGFGGSGSNGNSALGGFPNGGEGGTGVTGGDGPLFWAGGAGGGSSDIRTVAADPATRLVVGGAGGGAAFNLTVVTEWKGGTANASGGDGGNGNGGNGGLAGGRGATQVAPGAGGTSAGVPGDPGLATDGGNGGDSTSGGGGGGGGYFGGGGGAGSILTDNRGGGGAGSSFGPTGTVYAVNTVTTPTNGFVEITEIPNTCPAAAVAPIVRFAG